MINEIDANIASVRMNMNRVTSMSKRFIFEEYLSELEAMRQRVSKGSPVGPSLAILRAKLILRLNPGIAKMDFKEILGLPATARSNEQKVFRDFFRSLRSYVVVDEMERVWASNDPAAPGGARQCQYRIGDVVLDGNIKNNMRKAVFAVRDQPGITPDELFQKLKNSVKTKGQFNKLLVSLTKHLDEVKGKLFVKGYIPFALTAVTVPPKQVERREVSEPLSMVILDALEPRGRYDWGDVLAIYRNYGCQPQKAFRHFSELIREGWVQKQGQNYIRQ